MKLTGISDLLESERGCFAIFVTVIATVMVFMEKMTVDAWATYTQWIAIALITSKTVTTATAMVKSSNEAKLAATLNETKISEAKQ